MPASLSNLGGNQPIKKPNRKAAKNATDNATVYRKSKQATRREYALVFKQLEKAGKGRTAGVLKNLDVRSRRPGARNFIPKDFKNMKQWEKGKFIVENLGHLVKTKGSHRTSIYVTRAAIKTWSNNKALVKDLHELNKPGKQPKLSPKEHGEELLKKSKLRTAVDKGVTKREKQLTKQLQKLNIWSSVINNAKVFISKTDELAGIWDEARAVAGDTPGDLKQTFNEIAQLRNIF